MAQNTENKGETLIYNENLRPYGTVDSEPEPDWFKAPASLLYSRLPILKINTDNHLVIPDEPKIRATMGIIYNGSGQINKLTDPNNHYDGYIGIERRGNSSQKFPKKPYNIETRDSLGNNLNISLFGMPAENDWVLRASYMDHTFIRNPLAMFMSRQTGRWASRCQLVEVVLNDVYQGIYIFMEKIKWDEGRLDINKLDPDDLEEPDISGGYIYEITGFEPNMSQSRNLKYPKFHKASAQQIEYISSFDNGFRESMNTQDYMDEKSAYPSWIEVESFVEELLVQEAMRNSDAYGWSGYFHKDRGGKINAGPVWDFDQSAGNSSYPDNGVISGWMFSHSRTSNTPFFWEKLFSDPSFRYRIKSRWEQLRQHEFRTDHLISYIDSIAYLLSEAQAREFERWPVLGKDIWRETTGFRERTSYQKEVDYLKLFLSQRWAWMDSEIALIPTPVSAAITEAGAPLHELYIYPNPTTGFLIFELKQIAVESWAEIHIYNSSGMLVQKTPPIHLFPGSAKYRLDLDKSAPSGLYYYQVMIDGRMPFSGRFINLH